MPYYELSTEYGTFNVQLAERPSAGEQLIIHSGENAGGYNVLGVMHRELDNRDERPSITLIVDAMPTAT